MLKHGSFYTSPSARPLSTFSGRQISFLLHLPSHPLQAAKIGFRRGEITHARRRVIYEEDEDEEEEGYGQNAELAMLESYSKSKAHEVLLVRAWVDDHEDEVLIFKGFSSCLSGRTWPDPSKSVLPARAVIKSIDRVRGPFDPSNIDYLEKGLSWEEFKSRLSPSA